MNNIPNLENLYVLLFTLLVMFVASFYYIKRSKVMYNQNKSKMSILETLSLGTKEKIFLLQVNRMKILVGVTGNNIRTLHTFDNFFKETLQAQSSNVTIPEIKVDENLK